MINQDVFRLCCKDDWIPASAGMTGDVGRAEFI